MRDVIPQIDSWLNHSKKVAIATVVKTWGSAPRPAGSCMAINDVGDIVGSVSGGCVEGAIIEAGLNILNENELPQLLHFGVADETAWEVGLACGGEIEVFVQKLDADWYQKISQLVKDDIPTSFEIIIKSTKKNIGDYAFVKYSLSQKPRLVEAETGGLKFLNVIPASPTLLVVGGVQIAQALFSFAKSLNFKTILVDPRRTFGSKQRFPEVDVIHKLWPSEAFSKFDISNNFAIAILTHDPKIDDPALRLSLESKAFFVGALGSKSTHAKRKSRLLEQGVPIKQVNKIRGPIGLDISAITPEEIALAIMAEIVKVKNQQL